MNQGDFPRKKVKVGNLCRQQQRMSSPWEGRGEWTRAGETTTCAWKNGFGPDVTKRQREETGKYYKTRGESFDVAGIAASERNKQECKNGFDRICFEAGRS
jgi:hypothetical protein